MCAYFYMFECFKQAFSRKPEVSIEDISAYLDRTAEFMQLWKKARQFAGSRLPIPSSYARRDPHASYRPNPRSSSAVPVIAPSIAARPSSIPVLSSRGQSGALTSPVNASRRNVKVPAKAPKQARPSYSNPRIPVPSSSPVASGHKRPQGQAGTSTVPVPARRCGTPAPVPRLRQQQKPQQQQQQQQQQQPPRRSGIPVSARSARGSEGPSRNTRLPVSAARPAPTPASVQASASSRVSVKLTPVDAAPEKGKQKAEAAEPAQTECHQIPKLKGILKDPSCRESSNQGRRVTFKRTRRVVPVEYWIAEAWPNRKRYW